MKFVVINVIVLLVLLCCCCFCERRRKGGDDHHDLMYHHRRNKLDPMGNVLKKHVTRLRRENSQESDIVFLVDSSASVGAQNFYNEIKFIKKVRR